MNQKPVVKEHSWPTFFSTQNALMNIVGSNQAILTMHKLIKIQHLIKKINSK